MLPSYIGQIGTDRHLEPTELEATADRGRVDAAWSVYCAHFGGFTGSMLDPQFNALDHPATQLGSIRLAPGETAVIAGTGPSLHASLDALTAVRPNVRIFTSPRGAEVLLARGIVPDLVLVEHQTALDAHHSARHVGDRADVALARCPLVAAEWKTPAALLAGMPARALFVPHAPPNWGLWPATWGLWPATAAAMAIDGGAARLALLGVDLGRPGALESAHAPLAGLLSLLADASPVPSLDCGANGANKNGWTRASLAEAAGVQVRGGLERVLAHAPAPADRLSRAREDFAALRPIVERALYLSRLAIDARAGRLASAESRLEGAIREVMGWRHERRTRLLLQESLGTALLPRLWRIGVDPALGGALWRPLMLATHEIVGQAEAFATRAAMQMAA